MLLIINSEIVCNIALYLVSIVLIAAVIVLKLLLSSSSLVVVAAVVVAYTIIPKNEFISG